MVRRDFPKTLAVLLLGLALLCGLFQDSTMDGRMRMLEGVTETSGSRSTTMLVGIFTIESDTARRDLIRKTYLTYDGVCSLQTFLTAAEKNSDDDDCRVVYTFVVGGNADAHTDHVNDAQPLLVEEGIIEVEEDMTALNIRENMNKGKSYAWFKYASTVSSKIDYIAKMDSDTMVHIPKFIEFMNEDLPPSPYNIRFYGGAFTGNVAHDHLYMQGQFYFISTDLARYIGHDLTGDQRLEMTKPIKASTNRGYNGYFTHEDISVATLIHSHPRPLKLMSVWKDVKFWQHPVKKEEEWMKRWDGGRFEIDMRKNNRFMIPFKSMCRIFHNFYG